MSIKYLDENRTLFNDLLAISSQYLVDRPYLVGGMIRNHLLNASILDRDIDLTTNSSECIRLGILFSAKKSASFKIFEDKHLRVFYDGTGIDFSPGVLMNSHPGVKEWVLQNAPDKINYCEAYSRDFTINSMHQDIETGKIFDPTGLGINDITSKIIRTPVPPEITIKNDPRRIFRAIKLSSQHGLSIDSAIVDYVRENTEIILNQKLTTNYMTNEINIAFEGNKELAMSNIFDLGLFKLIPLSGLYSEYLIKNKMLSKYLS